eukprot:m51a1_g11846 putative charged multivesicular body protein 5 (211) ;mRNA; f:476966-477889
MQRIFGSFKPKAPAPSLDDACTRADARVASLDQRIAALDTQVMQLKERMKRARGPALDSLRAQALRLLKQKKTYEAQRDQMMAQSFNMQQVNFATQSVKDNMVTVDAMRTGARELKSAMKKMDVGKIEEMQDDMQDLLDMNAEISDALGRSYDTPEGLDETELEAELDALGAEMETEGETPSYLSALQAAPAPSTELPGAAKVPAAPQAL